MDGEETFLFLSNRRDRETNPELVKGSGANHYTGPPALLVRQVYKSYPETFVTMDTAKMIHLSDLTTITTAAEGPNFRGT